MPGVDKQLKDERQGKEDKAAEVKFGRTMDWKEPEETCQGLNHGLWLNDDDDDDDDYDDVLSQSFWLVRADPC